MTKNSHENRITVLELRLEEAIQMLRLVSKNQRTCLEVESWLAQNYPEGQDESDSTETLIALMSLTKRDKHV